MRVLVLNPGSSTLKAVVLEPPSSDGLGAVTIELGDDASRSAGRRAAVRTALDRLADEGIDPGTIEAVGVRVVHGGSRFLGPVLVDDAVLDQIAALADFAPLHNPIAVETIRAAGAALPGIPRVAAFDTAFHASLAAEAYRYAVPERWFTDWGVRRYGFHGLSVAWSVRRSSDLLAVPADRLRLVVAHLGSGCSVTAVDGGRSVDTTMGMTPLEGLVMGTRTGSLDPGILIRLLRARRLTVEELAAALDHESGMLGLSSRSSDVRVLLAAEAGGDERARLALAVFVLRAAAAIAAATTTLPGLDAVVFTGGIGEHSGPIRSRIVRRLAALGLDPLDERESDDDDDGILGSGHGPAVLRIAAREDIVIAEAVAAVVG